MNMLNELNDIDIPVLVDVIHPDSVQTAQDTDNRADALYQQLHMEMRQMVKDSVATALADTMDDIQQQLCSRIESSLELKFNQLIEQQTKAP